MSREVSLNPISLMGNTCTSSLYHSFYLANTTDPTDESGIRILFRLPEARREILDVESGVKYFIAELDLLSEDNFGSFVVTTSGGSKYFACFRGSSTRLFVAVSILTVFSYNVSKFPPRDVYRFRYFP